jgi:hypothetical protein
MNKFDELAKGMAQSVTRRQALKKFSVGLAGMALASFGLVNVAKAGRVKPPGPGEVCCLSDADCGSNEVCDFNIPCTAKKNDKTHQYGICHCLQCGQ